jgi:hypothetical protein
MNIIWKVITVAALLAVPAFAAGPFSTAIAVNPARTIVSDNDGWAATFSELFELSAKAVGLDADDGVGLGVEGLPAAP